MQSGSSALAAMSVSDTLRCPVDTRQNGDGFSEANPVNLAAYADRIQTSNIDILHYPVNTATYSQYNQSCESSSKFNGPIDLAVSTLRDHSQRSELLNSNNPVNLAAYAHKQLDYGAPAASRLSVSDVSVRSSSDTSQPSTSLPQADAQIVPTDKGTASAYIKDCTLSEMCKSTSEMCKNTTTVVRGLAAASSATTQQTVTYSQSQGVSLTQTVPLSYQSAQWQPVLSPHTAQLMATAVHASGQPLPIDNTVKEGERSPLLLQIQTAQLQALLRGFPPTSSAECQSMPSQRRQFSCNICRKALSSQHNLRLHEATIHHGLFQFHCPICNKGLRQERDLRGHLANRHDWKKEFRCSICGHEFGYKRNLKHHVMSHHGRSSLDE